MQTLIQDVLSGTQYSAFLTVPRKYPWLLIPRPRFREPGFTSTTPLTDEKTGEGEMTLLKVRQLTNDRARIQTQAFWFQSQGSARHQLPRATKLYTVGKYGPCHQVSPEGH